MNLKYVLLAIMAIPILIAGSAVISILSYLLIPMSVFAVIGTVVYSIIVPEKSKYQTYSNQGRI